MSHPTRRALLTALGASALLPGVSAATPTYRGPNVIWIRFGGGVRRRETIDEAHTFAPWLRKAFAPRGTLFTNMEIAQLTGVQTSHAQGTMHLLTGRYDHYEDIENAFLSERFAPPSPTLFELFRDQAGLGAHQVLAVNNENRLQDEFLGFSTHAGYGYGLRAGVLSRYRLKQFELQQRLLEATDDKTQRQASRALAELESKEYRRTPEERVEGPELSRFWQTWQDHYGRSGQVEPRGDRMQTELAIWALRELRPRLMVVNYSDCDYVHWGIAAHYHRGIAVMDQGLRRIVEAVEQDPFYRDNTVFAVVPDCGRDDNPLVSIPYQHHFGDRCSHEIFALFFGPGIDAGRTVDRMVQQVDVGPTLAGLMGLTMPHAEGVALEEVWA